MISNSPVVDLALLPVDNIRLSELCGQYDEHLVQVEQRLDVEINHRGHYFRIIGESAPMARRVLMGLYDETAISTLNPERVHLFLQESHMTWMNEQKSHPAEENRIKTRKSLVTPKGSNQQRYLANIQSHDINFGVGPAGTGKTFLAVACAIDALEKQQVQKIVLARPAVEAGERLGFLPGDLNQKVDPYLRPLYDALYDLMGLERVNRLIEKGVIEIAPLAFMRGRTLGNAFIILDEAQNTTPEQMKMLLTRLGFGSTAVITGDVTQIDLPRDRPSGLQQVTKVLDGVSGISFTFFDKSDIVRHPLVQKIVTAYEEYETDQNRQRAT